MIPMLVKNERGMTAEVGTVVGSDVADTWVGAGVVVERVSNSPLHSIEVSLKRSSGLAAKLGLHCAFKNAINRNCERPWDKAISIRISKDKLVVFASWETQNPPRQNAGWRTQPQGG
jgi:hypothetical protein